MKASSRNIFIISFIALIILNIILLIFYILMNPDISLYAQIFNYLGSRTFQYVTVSFGLPMLLFLIDYIFKFREKYSEDKKQRKINSIKLTEDLWNDIAKISTDFIYMEDFTEDKRMELNKNIDEFVVKAENVVGTWFFEFPDIMSLEENILVTDLFLTPINVLLSCIITIINNKKFYSDEVKIRELQKLIQIIYDGIKSSLHHQTLSILKNSMIYSETHEESYKNYIIEDINYLKIINKQLISIIFKSNTSSDIDIDLKDTVEYLEQMKDSDYEYKAFKKKLITLYNNIPDDKKIQLKDTSYNFSETVIRKIAYDLHIKEIGANFNHLKKQYKKII